MPRLAFLALWLAACGSSADKPATVAPAGDGAPVATKSVVVVELFTSQGCSSCPPADVLLAEIGAAGAIDGVDVIPLAYHVDYWNDLGWADPFSSAEWSQRQRAYAKRLPDGRVYTPQMVIDGTEHVVGSNRASVTEAVRRAAARDVLPVELRLTGEPLTDGVRVVATLELGAMLQAGRLDCRVGVFESGVSTAVARGENAGRELHDDFIVRRLTTVAAIEAGARGAIGELDIALDPTWNRARIGVVAFVQDSATSEIVAATVSRGL